MIICNIIVIPNKKPRFQKSEEDKDMIVNEISLVIQNIILETTGPPLPSVPHATQERKR